MPIAQAQIEKLTLVTRDLNLKAYGQTEAELEASKSALQTKEDQVENEAWTAYADFRSAALELGAHGAQVASATQSFEVFSGRYTVGEADIVELLNAQDTPTQAGSAEVQARTSMSISYANLKHAMGAALPEAFKEKP